MAVTAMTDEKPAKPAALRAALTKGEAGGPAEPLGFDAFIGGSSAAE
jgi:hypothetical protein